MKRGFFAVGIERTKTELNIGSLWRTAHVLGAAFLFTIARRYRRQASDTTHASQHVPLFHFDTLGDLRAHLPAECQLVGVELDPRARMLAQATHPERACYLLGAEDYGLSPAAIMVCDQIVRLPGERSLNVAVAGSIVLYDRIARRGEQVPFFGGAS